MYAAFFLWTFWRKIAQTNLLWYLKVMRSSAPDIGLLLLFLNQTLILLYFNIALSFFLSSKSSNSYFLDFRNMSEWKHGGHVNIRFIAHVIFAKCLAWNSSTDLYFADTALLLGSWLVMGHLVESDEYFRWFGFHLRNEYFR